MNIIRLAQCARYILNAALLSLAFVIPVHAQQNSPQHSGFYRTTIGNFTITALHDGHTRLATRLFHGANANDIRALLADTYLPNTSATINISVNAFLVQMGRHLVLVDTGAAQCLGPALGKLGASLHAAGYSASAVDMVLLTHLHADHACGLITAQGAAAFPKATLWVPRDEVQYWLSRENIDENQHAAFKMARASLAPYIAAKKLKTFKPGETILPGLVSIPSPGHTLGHTGYLFTSGEHSVYIWGDITLGQALQFPHPEISVELDFDEQQAIATRKEALADAAQKRLLIAGAHLPFPGLGHVRAHQGGGYRWVPIEYDQETPGRLDNTEH
jgi:glyoxylase-like metal-dependent hydrolase (beta-lactamase superfamily II)